MKVRSLLVGSMLFLANLLISSSVFSAVESITLNSGWNLIATDITDSCTADQILGESAAKSVSPNSHIDRPHSAQQLKVAVI